MLLRQFNIDTVAFDQAHMHTCVFPCTPHIAMPTSSLPVPLLRGVYMFCPRRYLSCAWASEYHSMSA